MKVRFLVPVKNTDGNMDYYVKLAKLEGLPVHMDCIETLSISLPLFVDRGGAFWDLETGIPEVWLCSLDDDFLSCRDRERGMAVVGALLDDGWTLDDKYNAEVVGKE